MYSGCFSISKQLSTDKVKDSLMAHGGDPTLFAWYYNYILTQDSTH